MLDTTYLKNLISAFKNETTKDSISPSSLGNLLDQITDALQNVANEINQVAGTLNLFKISDQVVKLPNVIGKIDVKKLDSLKGLCMVNNFCDFWVTERDQFVVGRVFMFKEERFNHKITQILITNGSLTMDHFPSGGHNARGVGIYYRFYGITSQDVPSQRWTDWLPMFSDEKGVVNLGIVPNAAMADDMVAYDRYCGNEQILQFVYREAGTGKMGIIMQCVSGSFCTQQKILGTSMAYRTIKFKDATRKEILEIGGWQTS